MGYGNCVFVDCGDVYGWGFGGVFGVGGRFVCCSGNGGWIVVF